MAPVAFVGSEDVLTGRILEVFFSVFNELGFGFVESVYCRAMAIALSEAGGTGSGCACFGPRTAGWSVSR